MTNTTTVTALQTIPVLFSLKGDRTRFCKSLRNYPDVTVNQVVQLKNVTENTTVTVKVINQTSDWLTIFEIT